MPPEQDTRQEPIVVEEEIRVGSPAAIAAVRSGSPYLIPASIILGAIIIGAFILVGLMIGRSGSTASGTDTKPGTQPTTAADVSKVKTAGAPYIGKENAAATMAYWSDYQCPFCKAFEVGGYRKSTTRRLLQCLRSSKTTLIQANSRSYSKIFHFWETIQ
jgi:hypothetical protein